MSRQVFISYSTNDSAIAQQMCDGLEAASIACWMAPRDIAPGLDYGTQIIEAIEACTVLVLVLSESSNDSIYVRNEVERAIAKRKVVIPFRIHNVTPSRSLEFFISNAQWIDAIDDMAAAMKALLLALAAHLAPTIADAVLAKPPIISLAPARHNLPEDPTPFLGREAELAALDDLMAQPEVRLVTIVGLGGLGKTRLSLAFARQQLATNRFPNGVFFVALAPLGSADQIMPKLAEALDFQLELGGGTRTPQQQLLDYLRQKHMLLLMDNFEHLLDGADLVAQILQAAPGVKVLASSRERLHLQEEQVYPIQGLEFPAWETPEDAVEYTAVRLFLQSARRIQPRFGLAIDDLTYLTRICRLVEGLPLAIELAAAWVDTLSLADIASEIQQNLDFLETDVRNVPARQRSIRAVFDYSWQRMTDSEQRIFQELSVFWGGFTRPAAQQIAGASVRALATLTSKSLLQFNQTNGRYQIHELLRQYGARQLADQPQAEARIRDRHSAWFAAMLQQQEGALRSDRQLAALGEIAADIENVRMAWVWAVEQKETTRISQALESLGQFWEWYGRFQEGENGCRAALAIVDEESDPRLRGRLLTWQATYCFWQGQFHQATSLLDRSLDLLERSQLAALDTRAERAAVLFGLGRVHQEALDRHGRQNAAHLLRQSLALYQALDDPWGMAKVLVLLGQNALETDADTPEQARQQLEEGERLVRQSVTVCRQTGNRATLVRALIQSSVNFFVQGRLEEALSTIEEAVELCHASGLRGSLVHAGDVQGLVLVHQGKYEQALTLQNSVIELAQELGYSYELAGAIRSVGYIDLAQGRTEDARRRFQECLKHFGERGGQFQRSLTLPWLGIAELYLGTAEVAQQHLVETLHLATQSHDYHIGYFALALAGLLLAHNGAYRRAIELYGLLRQTNFWDEPPFYQLIIRKPIIDDAPSTLSPEEVAAALERGRNLDLWPTMAALLEEFSQPDGNDSGSKRPSEIVAKLPLTENVQKLREELESEA
jgi:predicted ATPase